MSDGLGAIGAMMCKLRAAYTALGAIDVSQLRDALAVKVGLVKTLMASDPEMATGMLDELRGDWPDARG